MSATKQRRYNKEIDFGSVRQYKMSGCFRDVQKDDGSWYVLALMSKRYMETVAKKAHGVGSLIIEIRSCMFVRVEYAEYIGYVVVVR